MARRMFDRRNLLKAAGVSGALPFLRYGDKPRTAGERAESASLAAAEMSLCVESAASSLVEDHLVIAVVASRSAECKVSLWPCDDPSAIVQSGWKPANGARTAHFTFPSCGLAGRSWSYRCSVRERSGSAAVDDATTRSIPWRPKVGATAPFGFVFGSCVLTPKAIPTLRQASAENPAFFAMIGDMGYVDGNTRVTQDYALYSSQFRQFLKHSDVAPLLKRVPLIAVQDDHDYGIDTADRFTIKDYAARAFAHVVPGAYYSGNIDVPGANYRKWSIGQVDFFLLDNRRWKDPKEGPYENGAWMTVLGHDQRQWLKSSLAASSAALKVVFAPMPVSWYWSNPERAAIIDHINANVSGKVLFCSGDKHNSAFVDLSTAIPAKVYEFLNGALNNPVFSPTDYRRGIKVLWSQNGADVGLYNTLGSVRIDASTNTLHVRAIKADGTVPFQRTLPL